MSLGMVVIADRLLHPNIPVPLQTSRYRLLTNCTPSLVMTLILSQCFFVLGALSSLLREGKVFNSKMISYQYGTAEYHFDALCFIQLEAHYMNSPLKYIRELKSVLTHYPSPADSLHRSAFCINHTPSCRPES